MIRLLRPGPIGRVKAWRESVAMSLSRFVDWPCRTCSPPPLSIQCTYTETTRTKGSALITSYEGCSRQHAPDAGDDGKPLAAKGHRGCCTWPVLFLFHQGGSAAARGQQWQGKNKNNKKTKTEQQPVDQKSMKKVFEVMRRRAMRWQALGACSLFLLWTEVSW
ncbi:hypothetical protein M440DRAFT_1233446 [Trichoderma longibrachiatum ATCC 18648]|uniref:Uncharacterized protein n=1 Tax=Trichoderma longibrachiatum ATCC 18648 TaxID=983965 RepID=A0A2T4C5C6_TRILO|nr:hypothetical protein M440DRAFT_1233446 [Trichoderma longibrachiatum ATCC 18648]